MQVFKCDICGKETRLNPPSVPITKDEYVPFEEYDKKEMKNVTKYKLVKVPVSYDVGHQDSNGVVHARHAQKTEPLKPRTYIIRLSLGVHEQVQRDFCKSCYANFKEDARNLMTRLKAIVPKD